MNRRILALVLFSLSGCGYHVGTANLLPKTLHSIAVTPIRNVSTQYRLPDLLTAAITRELITRTRYRINADPANADATLYGAIVNYISYPTTFDPSTGRASGVQVIVILQVSLRERMTGKMLFNRPNMEVRERYEISVDPKTYFDESEPAMQRLSHDIAQSVITGILENF